MAATLYAGSRFFIDPTKVATGLSLVTTVQKQANPPTVTHFRPTSPLSPSPNVTVGPPVTVKSTHSGGVPNKG